MSRRQAREVALKALFQLDLNHGENDEQAEAYEMLAFDAAIEESPKLSENDREYAKRIVQGTRSNLEKVDSLIGQFSHDWKVERMAAIDRNIARIAAYEMKFSEEKLTPNIAINEAVELAKQYGTDDSARFVNGILGAMVR